MLQHKWLTETLLPLVLVQDLGEDEEDDDGCGRQPRQMELSNIVPGLVDVHPFRFFDDASKTKMYWRKPMEGPVRVCLSPFRVPVATDSVENGVAERPCTANVVTPESLGAILTICLESGGGGGTAYEFVRPVILHRVVGMLNGVILEVLSHLDVESQRQATEQRTRLRESVDKNLDETIRNEFKIFKDGSRTLISPVRRVIRDRGLLNFLRERQHFSPPSLTQLVLLSKQRQGDGDDVSQRLSEHQRGVLDAMLTQLSRRGWALLLGEGGTGKSHVVGVLARLLKSALEPAPKLLFAGPTNRSVAVLRDHLRKWNITEDGETLKCGTLHSLRTATFEADMVFVDESGSQNPAPAARLNSSKYVQG
jgi:hypothetical protein